MTQYRRIGGRTVQKVTQAGLGSALSLDPGDRTGWALWEGPRLTEWGIAGENDLIDLFDSFSWGRVQHIIYEDWRLQKAKATQQAGSHMLASQVIGMAKLHARQVNARPYAQEVSVITMAMLHSGIIRPRDHAKTHDIDAILHGFWWMERMGFDPVVPEALLSTTLA